MSDEPRETITSGELKAALHAQRAALARKERQTPEEREADAPQGFADKLLRTLMPEREDSRVARLELAGAVSAAVAAAIAVIEESTGGEVAFAAEDVKTLREQMARLGVTLGHGAEEIAATLDRMQRDALGGGAAPDDARAGAEFLERHERFLEKENAPKRSR